MSRIAFGIVAIITAPRTTMLQRGKYCKWRSCARTNPLAVPRWRRRLRSQSQQRSATSSRRAAARNATSQGQQH
eukprot:9060750-Pyramimonas_sp.AAC.1